ncbi:MAG: hypothetical protein JJU29_18750 [Verrucomicrobia bacterium]|nr:hypothetical protein [Verrucomicrobiota bacterium]MCH8510093.1 hypothetical protein [Kiritimatiellia bacterium]
MPGIYEVVLRSTADNYQENNDGLTAFSTVQVTVENPAAQANDPHYTKYRDEGPFSIFPMCKDVHSGFHGLANLDPRTVTKEKEPGGLLMMENTRGLRVPTQSDFEYLLEYTETLLDTPEWLPMGNWIPGKNSDLDRMDETPNVQQRFYRLRIRWATEE